MSFRGHHTYITCCVPVAPALRKSWIQQEGSFMKSRCFTFQGNARKVLLGLRSEVFSKKWGGHCSLCPLLLHSLPQPIRALILFKHMCNTPSFRDGPVINATIIANSSQCTQRTRHGWNYTLLESLLLLRWSPDHKDYSSRIKILAILFDGEYHG